MTPTCISTGWTRTGDRPTGLERGNEAGSQTDGEERCMDTDRIGVTLTDQNFQTTVLALQHGSCDNT
jgi:hypothetical protein